MFHRKKPLSRALILGGALIAPSLVSAQSLTPMRQIVTSYSDVFAIRVFPKNPYQHRISMEVNVYDKHFKRIPARVTPRTMMVGAGHGRSVQVIVPFNGENEKKVRICAESIPFTNQPTRIRTQVCGKFLAKRVK